MGYSYDGSSGRLCCDNCGGTQGVRKRTCPHKVLGSSHRSPGGRYALPYCSPPAYCSACFKDRGGSKGVHATCAEGAALYQAKADAEEAALDAGEKLVAYGIGRGDDIPEGYVKVGFQGKNGEKTEVFIPNESYDPGTKNKLSDYPEAVAA
jgi:hypothetical protein